jgi:hypothetical protein
MSTQRTAGPPPEALRATGPSAARYEYDDGFNGWMAFAGTMLVLLGTLNVIYGIAAIDSANVYVNNAKYVFSDLNTWGWIVTGIGAVQFIGGCSLFVGATFGRWIGIASAGANAIAQLLFLPSFPLLSLALFAVDVLVLYGLIAHGGKHRTA